MSHVITQSCCSDASCIPVCPVNCIHPTPDEPDYGRVDMLYIDPTTCIDCGACVDVCPVEAISPDYDLDSDQLPFQDLNASFYEDRQPTVVPTPRPRANSEVTVEPLRVAIVGSGPSACFTAEALTSRRGLDISVTMLERLPAPGGLVRYGVAPDHQRTKLVTDLLAATTGRSSVRLLLNVEVGKDVTLEELENTHHAVVYAAGADDSKTLDLPGTHLPGSYSAGEFVGWYNGHPDYANRQFLLDTDSAVIVGNGNVALDIARLLLSDDHTRASSDMADHAVAAFQTSAVHEVTVLGRRGPDQAAFSAKELIALVANPSINIDLDPDDFAEIAAPVGVRGHALSLLKAAADRPKTASKTLRFRFFTTPTAIGGTDRVELLDTVRSRPGDTPAAQSFKTGLIIQSVGFRSRAHPGLPYDPVRGIVPNVDGRVTVDGVTSPGLYVAGWLARGPSGVIGTNRVGAERVAQNIIEDAAAGKLLHPDKVLEQPPHALDIADWKRIDTHEATTGRATGRPRVKMTNRDDMLSLVRKT